MTVCWFKICAIWVIILLFRGIQAETIPEAGSPGDQCNMGNGVMGTCQELGACLQEGGVVVQREGKVVRCLGDLSEIYVCCRKPHLIAQELCEAWGYYWRGTDGGCNSGYPLIEGGEEANIGEFPHAALVGQKQRTSATVNYYCGGTLISPHFVMTAAHCLFNHREGSTYWVKLGEHDTEHDSMSTLTQQLQGSFPTSLFSAQDLASDLASDSVPEEQVIQVEAQIPHPWYQPNLKYHDIALLKLKMPAKLTKRVLPACLPYEYPENDYLGTKMTVVGWGNNAERVSATKLQKVIIPVVDRLMCSLTNANHWTATPQGITEDMICAGERGKDSCQGDSGGPLTIQIPRNGTKCEHTIVGVVSYGIGTDFKACGYLGVYGRVSSYLDWITGYIAPNTVKSN